MKKVLAFDMGATSIRGILGYIEEGKLITKEVMRASHSITETGGRLRWQWDRLLEEVKKTVLNYGSELSAIGVDTWGVDFGLIDKAGNLLEAPVSYRDSKNLDGYKEAVKVLSSEEIFMATGNQIMPINTLYQLVELRKLNKKIFDKADKILLMPDLFAYMLGGSISGEETIWSTSQLLNLKDGKYSKKILEAYGFSSLQEKGTGLFPEISYAGSPNGNTRNSLIKELRQFDIEIISVCGHDTASAVMLTSAFKDKDTMFLSCGTWSLLGVLTEEAVITKEAYKNNLTNEKGYGSANLFFKNITGLYLLEKFKAQLQQKIGGSISFDEINAHVLSLKSNTGIIDIEDESFSREDINAKQAIKDYLKKTSQPAPEEDMDYFKIIYESLVNKYLETKKALEAVLGKSYKKLHIIGGGARSELLKKLIKEKLKVELISGPYEASALGNIVLQLLALGEIKDIKEGIELALNAEEV